VNLTDARNSRNNWAFKLTPANISKRIQFSKRCRTSIAIKLFWFLAGSSTQCVKSLKAMATGKPIPLQTSWLGTPLCGPSMNCYRQNWRSQGVLTFLRRGYLRFLCFTIPETGHWMSRYSAMSSNQTVSSAAHTFLQSNNYRTL